ncbi:MAG: DNA methyltransferase [Sphingomonas sp.]|nr:ParB N-terminal domain-containing protein [Sphingomonas sp.]MDX3883230.1 DNA methyltransferase [Sphingomonas sp.]
MSGKIPLGPQSLKRQLQAANAKRRAHNQGKTRVVAAAHGHHRNDPQPDLVTVWKPVSSLRASPNRTRETTAHMLEGTVRSIQKFGMVLPILIDADDVIVAGHALWEAARQLDFDRIECRVIDHLDPIECEALALALNRIGEIGKYDLDKLRDRMIAIESHGIELVSTGFTLPEISQIKLTPLCDDIDDLEHDGLEDGVHSLSISREGDLFHLGHHQLLCGDAVAEASYQRLLNGTLVQMVFSDPPYHCKIAGFVSGLGKHKHEDFLMFAGQESDAEFRKFMEDYLRLCKDVMPSGAVIFACMDWRQIDTLLDAGRAAELNRINIAVWNKGSGGMGGYLRSAHEFVAIFCNGKSLAINNVALGVHGRGCVITRYRDRTLS